MTLPEPILQFYQLTNNADVDGLLSIFTQDALVIDEGKKRIGHEAIEEWAKQSIFGPHIQFKNVSSQRKDRFIVVTSEVDGDFDKTGLPDPFILAIHFSVMEGKINELICGDFDSI